MKLFLAIVICYQLFVLSTKVCLADEKFNITYDTTYSLDQNGSSEVIQHITIQNRETEYYASDYTLTLVGKKPKNLQIYEIDETSKKAKQVNLPFKVENRDNEQDIIVSFIKHVVGKEKSRTFTISYLIDETAIKNGEVWDITIPRLANPETVENYNLTLNIPLSYGNPAFISPLPKLRKSSLAYQTYIFEKDDLVKAGIVSSFGEFQIYKISINYHLENPDDKLGEATIALPPDTAFQRVYYENIDPQPARVYLDDDGNWLAAYYLEGKEKQEITAILEVQVFAKPQSYYSYHKATDSPYYLNSSQYWETTSPEISKIISTQKTLKGNYDYVVSSLNYDYSKVGTNVERLGATKALSSPNNAICTEYTDLFITLSRASGIPAREVNGYAYTEDNKLQPLSSYGDLLHSWPEYWDTALSIWKPVDPTWEDTTGGVDYFNKFDLSHIVFAIHGKDPKFPIPGGAYKPVNSDRKDIHVEFGSLPFQKDPESALVVGEIPFLELPFKSIKRTFYLVNTGKVALYDVPISIEGEGLDIKSPTETNIRFLAPKDQIEIPVSFKTSLIPSFSPMKITIVAGDSRIEYDIPIAQVYGIQILAIFSILLGAAFFSVFSLHIVPKGISHIKRKK